MKCIGAGAFIGSTVPYCPPMATVLEEATHHVGWRTDRPSSFISVTSSCIRAMLKVVLHVNYVRWLYQLTEPVTTAIVPLPKIWEVHGGLGPKKDAR